MNHLKKTTCLESFTPPPCTEDLILCVSVKTRHINGFKSSFRMFKKEFGYTSTGFKDISTIILPTKSDQ